ncbi:MAG TPA: hypothetical protein VGK19_20585 [Capsulimonadaceae bacterium]|jgi:hypothetical protein
MDNKHDIRVAKLKIRKILLDVWDPIGVRTEPLAQGEYDMYLGGIYMLLVGSATDPDIVEHLRKIETDRMGLRGQSEEPLRTVVGALRELDVSSPQHAHDNSD